MRVAGVGSQQVAGEEEGAVTQHGEIRLAAEEVGPRGERPRLAPVFGSEEQDLFEDLTSVFLVLVERGDEQLAVGQAPMHGL